MSELWEGLVQAVQLIARLDPEVMEISLRSLYVSAASIVIAALFCVPIGGLIHFHEFRGKKVLINVIQTFYSIPTVVVGLFVFLFISRAGPLGGLIVRRASGVYQKKAMARVAARLAPLPGRSPCGPTLSR